MTNLDLLMYGGYAVIAMSASFALGRITRKRVPSVRQLAEYEKKIKEMTEDMEKYKKENESQRETVVSKELEVYKYKNMYDGCQNEIKKHTYEIERLRCIQDDVMLLALPMARTITQKISSLMADVAEKNPPTFLPQNIEYPLFSTKVFLPMVTCRRYRMNIYWTKDTDGTRKCVGVQLINNNGDIVFSMLDNEWPLAPSSL